MSHYIAMWTNYFNFSGRTSRAGYWWAVLFNWIISLLLGWLLPPVGTIYGYLALIPGIALCFRRLHDVGKSGWWYLFNLLPVIGWIILIVQYCKPSQYSNVYEG